MKFSFEIQVTQKEADIALRRFIFRGAGIGMPIAIILCLSIAFIDWSHGGIGILSSSILTLLAVLVIVYVAAFIIRRRQMKALLNRLGDSGVMYTLDDSELSTKTILGSSTIKWEMVKKLWIDPDVVLVFYARNGYTTIPTQQIPTAALEFLENRVRSVKGIIVNNIKT